MTPLRWATAGHQHKKRGERLDPDKASARPNERNHPMNALVMADSGTWSLGTLVGVPVAIVFVLVGLAWIGLCVYEHEWGFIWLGVGWVVLVVAFAASPLGFWPFSAEYHQWREVSGTVQQIDKRLISDGYKGMSDKFVVRIDGQQFGCDDTRCASVHEGDGLTLSCKRAWQYTGTDGYDCRFVSTEATR